jgi:acyl carrier protein
MNDLIEQLKRQIIKALALEDVVPEAIDPDAQLVGGPLGIDSIDVLELVMLVEKEYGLVIDSKELGARVFTSLRTLADYVRERSARGA